MLSANGQDTIQNSMFVDRFLFWDVESTGRRPTKDDIISLGGVLAQLAPDKHTLIQVDTFHSYVNTPKIIPDDAIAVHHITQSMLQGQPDFPTVVTNFTAWLTKHQPEPLSRLIWVAHNGRTFDEIMLYCNMVMHRLPIDQLFQKTKTFGFLDSLRYLRSLLKKPGDQPFDQQTKRISYALKHCYTSFCSTDGSCFENAHDALADSQALFDVFCSHKISTMIRFSEMLKAVVPLKKGVEHMRACNVKIHEEEQRTIADVSPPGPSDLGPSGPPTKRHRVETRFAPVTTETTDATCRRQCLNCLLFVEPGEHRVCDVCCPSCRQFVKPGEQCKCANVLCAECKEFGHKGEHSKCQTTYGM